jgi:hypothetical protein
MARRIIILINTAAGSDELPFSGVHFSKAEDFHKRPAYWPSSFQRVVDIGAM